MKIFRNILAVILGGFIGAFVNGCIIMISGSVIPLPEGADVTTMEGLKATIHLFEPRHFIMPFLAHAIGTLVGAIVAGFIAASHKRAFVMTVGCLFLVAGIANCFMLPAPVWFMVVDVVCAYIPMAWIASKIAARK